MIDAPHPLDFFAKLRWLDGRPSLDTIEPYRRAIFETVLYTFDGNRPRYNLAVCGRAKKNWKTSDLILAALYRLLVWPSPQGNDCFVLANDEGQAADDLDLAKKLVHHRLAKQHVFVACREGGRKQVETDQREEQRTRLRRLSSVVHRDNQAREILWRLEPARPLGVLYDHAQMLRMSHPLGPEAMKPHLIRGYPCNEASSNLPR